MASIKKKLEKNGNVVYQVQASNGRGRRGWRTFRPEPTWSSRTVQRELQRFAAELESQLEDREVLTREETIQQAAAQAVEAAKVKTLRQYAGAVYLPEKAATVSEKTRASYTQLLEQHVFPVLGDVPMQDITAAMLKALLAGLPERFAFASRVKVYAVLHGMFKAAVMDDTLDVNPMDKVPRPKQSKDAALSAEHKAFTAEEMRYILRCLKEEPLKWQAFVLLLIDTGCRRGEACGLQWRAVDLDVGTITIERNLQYTAERGVYETMPKNGKVRVVDISPDVAELLRAPPAGHSAVGVHAGRQRGAHAPGHAHALLSTVRQAVRHRALPPAQAAPYLGQHCHHKRCRCGQRGCPPWALRQQHHAADVRPRQRGKHPPCWPDCAGCPAGTGAEESIKIQRPPCLK